MGGPGDVWGRWALSESDIVCVATTPNRALAHVWRNALEAEGIECQVGDYLTFWFDNMPWSQADVWVHRAHAHRAREILEHQLPSDSPLTEQVCQY
jgi:hypothetical protein